MRSRSKRIIRSGDTVATDRDGTCHRHLSGWIDGPVEDRAPSRSSSYKRAQATTPCAWQPDARSGLYAVNEVRRSGQPVRKCAAPGMASVIRAGSDSVTSPFLRTVETSVVTIARNVDTSAGGAEVSVQPDRRQRQRSGRRLSRSVQHRCSAARDRYAEPQRPAPAAPARLAAATAARTPAAPERPPSPAPTSAVRSAAVATARRFHQIGDAQAENTNSDAEDLNSQTDRRADARAAAHERPLRLTKNDQRQPTPKSGALAKTNAPRVHGDGACSRRRVPQGSRATGACASQTGKGARSERAQSRDRTRGEPVTDPRVTRL